MADRMLTEQVKACSLTMGMDLVGFGPVSRWKNAPYLLSPQAILPEAKTVVVSAIHITDTWTEMGGEPEPQDRSPGGWMDQNSLLDRVAYRLVRTLQNRGHKAIAVASSNIWRYRAFEGIPSLFAPDLSHIHAATAAGLAEIGWCGLAITPEFGARCRFISVVTDAELVPTPMYNGPQLCDMCMECVKHCPTASLVKELGKPHEVTIGGRTFTYANKNIWRCAWAEHFNLDLNSENLKQWDKVGEKEILSELMEHGYRGHERGVCQKFCVPPHLRSKEASFGRSEKLISQNRINKRYPDSMPTLRKMRDDILAAAIEMGMDVASVGTLDTKQDAGKKALQDAPGMRTVIALGYKLPENIDAAMSMEKKTGAIEYAFSKKMHHTLLRIARIVEDYGYHAASYTGQQLHHGQAELSEQLAAMTDLGEVKDGVFETPEFGKCVMAGAITTDAPIDATNSAESYTDSSTTAVSKGAKLRRQLESLAERNLVSLFGVAKAESFAATAAELRKHIDETQLGEYVTDKATLSYHGPWQSEIHRDKVKICEPTDYVANAKSVIVLGMHFSPELMGNAGLDESKQIGTYGFHHYQTTFELRYAACELLLMLDKMGYTSMVTEDMLGVGSLVNTPRSLLPDMRCNVLEAAAAGLGEVSCFGGLLTPDYGPNQRFIVIVTDAELPVDHVYDGEKLCKECGKAEELCPMHVEMKTTAAIPVNGSTVQWPMLDRHRCDWSKRYALNKHEGPALIGSTTHVEAPDGAITIEMIAKACEAKDPIMKSRTCILETCQRWCAAGKA